MPTNRPHGRNLSDFGKLSSAETKLLRYAARGELCDIGPDRPEMATPKNRIRAGFIRFLALGGDDDKPVHENGIWLVGAWIDGVLDIDFCTLPVPLQLRRCHLERLDAREAQLPRLALSGTWVAEGINADGIRVAGSIFLNDQFKANGSVRLLGAQMGGNLECNYGNFEDKEGIALSLDTAKIKGSVFLGDSFKAKGEVCLLGAQIGGSLNCSGGDFSNKGAHALNFDSANIKGNVFLEHKFNAEGEVRLLGAHIGGNLDCSGGSFVNEKGNALSFDGAYIKGNVVLADKFKATGEVRLLGAQIGGDVDCIDGSFDNMDADALSLERAIIKGSLFLRAGFAAKGRLLFAEAQIGSLIDAAASSPEPGQLVLDGLTIGRLAGGAPTNGQQRVAWLKRQDPDHLASDFCPQPWEEMIRVLRAMGHDEDAKTVAIAKQDQLRVAGKIDWRQQLRRPFSTRLNDGSSARFSVVGWALHGLWGQLARYGYRPLRLVGWMLCVWAIGSGLFWLGMKGGYMAPTSPIVITNGSIDAACDAGPDAGDRRWTLCPKLPDEYSTFQPMAYSLDVILPVISLQQDTEWAPVVGNATRWYWPGIGLRAVMWFEILFGWMGSLLLIAIFTNLVKKD